MRQVVEKVTQHKSYNVLINIVKLLGVESSNVSFIEKVIAGLGAVVSIYLTYSLVNVMLDTSHSYILLAAIGSSAVLMFAVPHGVLSQPWHVIGGHLFSAITGYLAVTFISDASLASAIAVGGSIWIMYFTRCLHPPGGATALFMVITGQNTEQFNALPIFQVLVVNIGIIIAVCVLFNSVFYWRRYPAFLSYRLGGNDNDKRLSSTALTHEDFCSALVKLDSYVDVSTEELAVIFELAMENANKNISKKQKALQLKEQSYYSNAALGAHWGVRQIVSIDKKFVHFKPVAGAEHQKINSKQTSSQSANVKQINEIISCSIKEFKQWAKLEVVSEKNVWLKKSA